MPLTPPVGLRKAIIRPRRIPSTTSTGTSARTNSSAICHNISLSRALFKTTFKCSVVIPDGPPAAPLRPCRTHFKNLSWSRENCVAGLCRISSPGSGALNSGGLWRGSWGHPSWCHLLERMWLPCWRELTQLNQSLCAFSPRLNTVNLSVTSTQRSCFVSCGSCLPLPQRGDPVAFCKHGKPFTELVLGDQPSLPCLKRRILGSNRKSFHARVLDGSDLWQSLLHCKPHCTLVRPFRNAGGFFITNVLSRKTFSRFTSSSVANALEIARLLLTTGTTTSSTLDSTRWGMPSASNSVSSSLDATGSRWSTSGTLTRVSVSESTASSWTL